MKTLFSILGYAVVACVFMFTWLISPRMYFFLALGAFVYVTGIILVQLYAAHFRLFRMKFRGWFSQFRLPLPYPTIRLSLGIGR